MATSIITKFVLQQLGKKSLRKTGIATLNKASDSIVKSNVRNIEIILKNMGVDLKNLKSTDDVLKHMNYHNAMFDQSLKQQAEKLFPPGTHKFFGRPLKEKDFKEIDKLYPPKKDPYQGFTPKVVPKETEAQVKARLLKTQKETLERLRKKKKPEEPEFASGGIAGELRLNEGGRVPMLLGGNPIKWGKGIINYLRKIAAERAEKKKFMAELDKKLFDEKGNLKEGAVEKHFQDMTEDFNRQIDQRKEFLTAPPPKDRKLHAAGGLVDLLSL